MENEIDEKDIYLIYAKLQKAGMFDYWQKFSKKVTEYLRLEWTERPTGDEILNVVLQFANNDKKLQKCLNEEDFGILITLLYTGLDVLIHPEENEFTNE